MLSFILLIFTIISCHPTFARKNQLQKIDQISYIGDLKKNRPDLIASDCKNNLILKLKYRKDVLTKKTDYQKILATEYTTENKAKDAIWSENFRAAARKLREQMEADFKTKGIQNTAEARRSLPYFVANYDSGSFVGYQVKGPIDYDKQGLMPKIFLSFKSAIDDLSPERYLQFTNGLSNAGFIGDSKVRLIEGSERFHFNNIIIHAATLKDALIAEKFGILFFGEKLEAIGRGFDVAEDKGGKNVLDWSNFLCTKSPANLPAEAMSFLKYN